MRKFADISTRYITKADSFLLDQVVCRSLQADPIVVGYDEGWFVYVGNMDTCPNQKTGFSSSLVRICREACKQGFAYVNFDRDGEVYDGIETYDW